MKHVLALGVFALCLLLPGVASAQQARQDIKISVEDEEQMDSALRKFGYVSGQAFQCHSKEEQIKLERTALNVATNILRLFGSDRAFFYAAAFGAGMTDQMDRKTCPAAIKQATDMIAKLKILSER
jgi:alanine-alpha-ketoisovalerate/valine-pyruvate aminotransferase